MSMFSNFISRPKILFITLCLAIGFIVILQMQYTEIRSYIHYFQLHTNRESATQSTDRHVTKSATVSIHEHKEVGKGSGGHIDRPTVPDNKEIVIGCAITSRGVRGLNGANIGATLPLFQSLLPSFCKTASAGFKYHFYISHDHNDPFFSKAGSHEAFQLAFNRITSRSCAKTFNTSLHFVQCSHSGSPAWAQNDAMIEAYIDHRAYFYRINDDTVMQTPGWSEAFISSLAHYNPPNVGVVGPRHHGGNEGILTYDFTHRTHVDIFGFYYPRVFTDWYADDWITKVYTPGRSTKLNNIQLLHTMSTGTRYNVRGGKGGKLAGQLRHDKKILERYLEAREAKHDHPSELQVVSMSLFGADPKYTFGVIRNAFLVPQYLPGWKLRVYVEKPNASGKTKYAQIPERILRKIELVGAHVIYVDPKEVDLPPQMWRFLVAGDQAVSSFVVRDADSRMSERDAFVIQQWLYSKKPFHCVRDHPIHQDHAVLPGLWGGKPEEIKQLVGKPFDQFMTSDDSGRKFVQAKLWDKVKDSAYCHDSVSCKKWPNAHPFTHPMKTGESFIGQKFDPMGEQNKTLAASRKGNYVADCVNPSAILDKNGKVKTTLPPTPAPTIPHTKRKLVFWSMDYQIGPIRDLKNLLEPAGVIFIDKSLSVHCGLTQTCAKNLRAINVSNGLDPGPDVIEKFYNEYKSDPEMQSVTHFVCINPTAMCQVYKKFNKNIIIIATRRYEKDRFTAEKWKAWNDNIKEIAKDSKNIVAANNRYDQEYMKYFTGIQPDLIPSYCGYVDASYNPTKPDFILWPVASAKFMAAFQTNFQKSQAAIGFKGKLTDLKTLYPTNYKLSDLASYKGIVYAPYEVSFISLCEHYRMNVPMFVPSLEILTVWQVEHNIVSERTFNSYRKNGDKYPIPGVEKGPDPNTDKNHAAVRHWLQYAEYYQKDMPHIQLYSSIGELVSMLDDSDLQGISRDMKNHNSNFRKKIVSKWTEALNRIS